MRVSVALRQSYKLINHGPTTLIASAAGERRNVMAAAWVMGLDFDPPKLAAVIAADTLTRELVELSGEFVVSLPPRAMAEAAYAVGSVSGRDGDKFARFGLRTTPASEVQAPLVDGCVAWLECRVVPEPHLEREYDLFVAEVVAAWADDEAYVDGEWNFRDDALRTIHHVSKGTFLAIGEKFRVERPAK